MNREYFYGEQAESYSFYRIPRQLITGEKYKGLSVEAKLLYGMMLDRMGLSLRNGWLDKTGRVYIYYTVEEIQSDLGCGHVKAGRLLAELDTVKGIGLIERVRQGQGKPTKIYVKKFYPDPPPQREKSGLPRLPQNDGQDSAKAEFRSAASCRSGHTESGGADRQKPAGSYIENNYPESSYTDPSIVRKPLNGSHCRERQCSKIQELSSSQTQTQSSGSLGFAFENEGLEEEIKEQIDYPLLALSYPEDDPDCILELICDVLTSSSPGIKIGGETIPTAKVQTRFRRLQFDHVAYVLDSLRETTTKIINIRAYLLTALYNAPLTIGPYYSAAVRHDSMRQ